jgi:hypothetical protein
MRKRPVLDLACDLHMRHVPGAALQSTKGPGGQNRRQPIFKKSLKCRRGGQFPGKSGGALGIGIKANRSPNAESAGLEGRVHGAAITGRTPKRQQRGPK